MTCARRFALPTIALLAIGLVPVSSAAQPAFEGVYIARGVDSDGKEYRRAVEIERHGDSFTVTWVTARLVGEAVVLEPSWFGLGIVTGVVGAAGGLGGFFLPSVLGAVREMTGSYALGLFGCAVVFVAGTFVLLELGARWSLRWERDAVQQAGVYSYRNALFGTDSERAA